MMLNKFIAYRKAKKNQMAAYGAEKFAAEKLGFEIASDLKTIREIQKFRAEVFGMDFNIQFPDNMDRDLFDMDCEHAIIRSSMSGKIVAYTRFYLLPEQHNGRCYSAQEFDLGSLLEGKKNIVEIGRTCVHPDYRSGKALGKLWYGLLPYVLGQLNAKYIIGCVSVSMGKSELRALKTHALIQQLPNESVLAVNALKPFQPQRQLDSTLSEQDYPSLFRHYLSMQAKFSRQACVDPVFNCLDYFAMLEVNEMAKAFIQNFECRK